MIKNSTLVFSLLLIFSSIQVSYSQNNQKVPIFNCKSDLIFEQRLNSDSKFKKEQEEFEKIYRQNVQEARSAQSNQRSIVHTIPTVVHIIHDGQPLGTIANPDDETVQMIIQEASDRFRHQQIGAGQFSNPFYGADTEIELCLIDSDENGNYSTGIYRHYNTTEKFNPYNNNLDDLEFDPNLYMNIFVINSFIDNTKAIYVFPNTIYTNTFFFPGAICHEVGHFLSLRHTFQDGCENDQCLYDNDYVCDTPPDNSSGPCDIPTNVCTTDEDDTSTMNPYRPIALGGLGDQPSNVTNYMNNNFDCWDSFTQGQKTRMHAKINSQYLNLVGNSIACNSYGLPSVDAAMIKVELIENDPCEQFKVVRVVVKNNGANDLTSYEINIQANDGTLMKQSVSSLISTNELDTVDVSFPAIPSPGLYQVFVSNANSLQVDDFTNNDLTYLQNVQFYGHDYCETHSACDTINPDVVNTYNALTEINITGNFVPMANLPNEFAEICVTATGYLDRPNHTFEILNEFEQGKGYTDYNLFAPCEGQYVEPVCFTATPIEFNLWIIDDTITITLKPKVQHNDYCDIEDNIACAEILLVYGKAENLVCEDLNIACYTTEIALCGGNNGSVEIIDDEANITSVVWDTNANNQTGLIATGLAPGNYSATVTENDGNTYVFNATVEQDLIESQFKDKIISSGNGGDNFGNAMDATEEWAVFGAPRDDTGPVYSSNSGAAYMYRNVNGTWTEFQKLKSSDNIAGARFGSVVAIHDDVVAISAVYFSTGAESSKVYIFRFDGAQWIEEEIIYAELNGAADWFGGSLNLEDDVLVIGRPLANSSTGEVYIYNYNGTNWIQDAILSPSSLPSSSRFGRSVSKSQNQIAIGTSQFDYNGNTNSGSVYIYKLISGAWTLSEQIFPLDYDANDYFGKRIELLNDRLIISSTDDDDKGTSSGSVYIFENNGTSFIETQKLTASNGMADNFFGNSLSMTENTIIISAYKADNNGSNQGAAYLFNLVGNNWVEHEIIISSDIANTDYFSLALKILDSGTMFFTAPLDDGNNGSNSGSAYVYTLANYPGDDDSDRICNDIDNCINTYNPDQLDSDQDGIGDVCFCPDFEIITTNFGASSVEKIEVHDYIEASNVIEAGANITYDAASSILLNLGFEVESSAIFHAYIDGCGNE